MQLYNSPIPPKAVPVARESLAISDAMYGNQMMTPPNTGMYNSDDGGAFSKPYVNAQPTENAFLEAQNRLQNAETAAPQAAAGAMGAVRKMSTEASTAEYRSNELKNEYVAGILNAKGGGNALMGFNALMNGPDQMARRNDVATTRAMFSGQAPELGAERAQSTQYMA